MSQDSVDPEAPVKVLFLDMDGVVNSAQYFDVLSKRAYRRARGAAKQEGRGRGTFVEMIDPPAVLLLNEVLATTGAKVVLSSSWRSPWTYQEVQGMLEERGFTGELVSQTPVRVAAPPGDQRGYEIQQWLDEHPEVEVFAILDDSDDMAHLMPRLVRTTWARGLEREHVAPLINLLGEDR